MVKALDFFKDVKGGVFGEMVALMSRIEFQKRGLPHMHILEILKEFNRICTSDDINRFVSAELSIEMCDVSGDNINDPKSLQL